MFIKKMRDNIKELVDFEKLRECNTLLFKWAKRLNIGKRDFMKTAHGMYKNPESYKKMFEVRFRSQYKKDCAVMFYASSVENTLCEQYSGMVANIITRKFKINDPDFFEDHFNDGLMAIRAAAWQFRRHKVKASFNTFVHRAIFMRIQGALSKKSDKARRRSKYAKVHSFSDYPDTTNFDLVSKEYSIDNSEVFDKQIADIIQKVGLNEKENFIINSFINRKIDNLWYKEYREKFRNEIQNKPYSRQSIHNQLLAVQIKVLKFLKREQLIEQDFMIKPERTGA
jgi:hypothetical protein